jgi:hypothetical protein
VFLGYVFSEKGIEMNEVKIKAIQEWLTPKTISEVRNFHGLTSFYKRFVKDFRTLATPLNEIVKKMV